MRRPPGPIESYCLIKTKFLGNLFFVFYYFFLFFVLQKTSSHTKGEGEARERGGSGDLQQRRWAGPGHRVRNKEVWLLWAARDPPGCNHPNWGLNLLPSPCSCPAKVPCALEEPAGVGPGHPLPCSAHYPHGDSRHLLFPSGPPFSQPNKQDRSHLPQVMGQVRGDRAPSPVQG